VATMQTTIEVALRLITTCSFLALLSSCVEVDGYRLREDGGASGSSNGSAATGGTGVVSTTAVARGGMSSKGGGGQGGTTGIGGASMPGGTTGIGGASTAGKTATSGYCDAAQSPTGVKSTLACSDAATEVACAALPGCSYTTVNSCSAVKALTCAELSYSVEACAVLLGCTSTGEGTCKYDITATCDPDPFYGTCPGTADCTLVTSRYYCQEARNCRWATVDGSCSGQPTPCASLVTPTACASSFNCVWQTGTCSGTPIPCTEFATREACEASDNCSWVIYL
jgi:hypothetical protein